MTLQECQVFIGSYKRVLIHFSFILKQIKLKL